MPVFNSGVYYVLFGGVALPLPKIPYFRWDLNFCSLYLEVLFMQRLLLLFLCGIAKFVLHMLSKYIL